MPTASKVCRRPFPFSLLVFFHSVPCVGRAAFEAEMERSGEEAKENVRQLQVLCKRENDRYAARPPCFPTQERCDSEPRLPCVAISFSRDDVPRDYTVRRHRLSPCC